MAASFPGVYPKCAKDGWPLPEDCQQTLAESAYSVMTAGARPFAAIRMAGVKSRPFNVLAGISLGVCVVFGGLWLESSWSFPNWATHELDLPGYRLVFSGEALVAYPIYGVSETPGFQLGYFATSFVSAILPAIWLITRRRRYVRISGGSRDITAIVGLFAYIACASPAFHGRLWGILSFTALPFPLAPLLGAVRLFLASVGMLLSRGSAAVVVALISTVPVWIFYGPVSMRLIVIGMFPYFLSPFIPPLLLLVATVLMLFNFRSQIRVAIPTQ